MRISRRPKSAFWNTKSPISCARFHAMALADGPCASSPRCPDTWPRWLWRETKTSPSSNGTRFSVRAKQETGVNKSDDLTDHFADSLAVGPPAMAVVGPGTERDDAQRNVRSKSPLVKKPGPARM